MLVKGHGLLAAGGHQAELCLRSSDPLESWSLSTLVGHSINNSISISASPFHPLSVPRLCVSNNDASIYRYELHFPGRWASTEAQAQTPAPKMMRLKQVRLDTPVNHCSTSPDGRMMVAVGDTNEVHVIAVNAAGQASPIDSFECEYGHRRSW